MASELEKLMAMGSMAAGGGYAQAALGGAQALYGLSQLPKARAEFERARAAAPSLETPSQFYENYRNAYDATLAGMQSDAIQANLASSVQALQGAGGRALVGGLSQATAQSQIAQNQMLAQERQMRLAAGQQLAAAEERTIGRKEKRSQQQQAYANQAYQAALGNIGAGLGAVGEGLMYGMTADKKSKQTGTGAAVDTNPESRDVLDKGFSKKTIRETEKLQKELDATNFMQQDEEAEALNEFLNDNANFEDNRLQEEARAERAGILPRINTRFQTAKALRNTNMGDLDPKNNVVPSQAKGFLPFGQDAYKNYPSLQSIDMTSPAERFSNLAPVRGSAIPKEFQNEQALKQLDALGKMYDNAAPALNSLLPVQPKNPKSYQQIPVVNEYLPLLRTQAFFRHGGMMTDGSFSHESNPIDIVQEGQKVGEMTGGEYIINPTQAKKIAKESSYARKLFKRFEKKAKNNK